MNDIIEVVINNTDNFGKMKRLLKKYVDYSLANIISKNVKYAIDNDTYEDLEKYDLSFYDFVKKSEISRIVEQSIRRYYLQSVK